MNRRALAPLLALALAAACGRDDAKAPAAGTPDTAGSPRARAADGGLPDQDMKVTVDTQRVEPAGTDSVAAAPDAGS